MSDLDLDTIRHALKTARHHGFRSVKLKVGDSQFRAVLEDIDEGEADDDLLAMALAEANPSAPERVVTSPFVGFFHPAADLATGQAIEAQQVLGNVQALGHPNEVHAACAGTLEQILVSDGEPVEYGQSLVVIKL